ncbi:MAG: LEA type 2 family protein [Bacteroidia bacterium]
MSGGSSKNRKWGIALLVLILLAVGVGIVAGWLKSVDLNAEIKPTVDSVYVEIREDSPEMATLRFYVSLNNFLPFDVQFDSIKYEIIMNDTLLAAGQQLDEIMLESNDRTSVPVPLRLSLAQYEEAKRPEGNAVRVRFHLFTKFPIIGTRELEFGTSRDFNMSNEPALAIHSADIDLLGEEEKVADIALQLNLLKDLPGDTEIDSLEMRLQSDELEFLVVEKQKEVKLGEKGQEVIVPAALHLTKFRALLKSKEDQDSMWVNLAGYAALKMQNKLLVRFNIDRRIRVLRPPEITLDSWKLTKFAFDTTEIMLTLQVVNENNFGLTIHRVSYRLDVKDELMAEETATQKQRVDGHDLAFLELPVNIKPARAGWTSLKVLLGSKPDYKFWATLSVTSDVEAVGDLTLRLRREGTIDIKKIKNK